MYLSYVYDLFHLGYVVWKIWPTNYYMHAMHYMLVNARLTTLYNAGQSCTCIFLANTTTNELNAKIERLLGSGLPLYGT